MTKFIVHAEVEIDENISVDDAIYAFHEVYGQYVSARTNEIGTRRGVILRKIIEAMTINGRKI